MAVVPVPAIGVPSACIVHGVWISHCVYIFFFSYTYTYVYNIFSAIRFFGTPGGVVFLESRGHGGRFQKELFGQFCQQRQHGGT